MIHKYRTSALLGRRAFLSGTGIATIGLPFLEGIPMRSAWAAGDAPVFGLFMVTALGIVDGSQSSDPAAFWPPETGPLTTVGMQAFAADRCTGLLADHAERLLLVRGVDYPYPNTGDAHAEGFVQSLTASQPVGSNSSALASGPSVDTLIADALHPGTDPLTLYAGMKGGFIDERISFDGSGMLRTAEANPYVVYQRLMGLFPGSGVADRHLGHGKSINDTVLDELNELLARPDLSGADRRRLEQHFEAIRGIETTISSMAAACSDGRLDVAAIEALSEGNAFRRNGAIEEVAKLQVELAAIAFACNATRVATLQCGDAYDGTTYELDGMTLPRFSYIAHRNYSDGSTGSPMPEAVDWHMAIDRIRMGTFRHLIERWLEYTTEAGSLLDHGFALWTNGLADGYSHSFRNVPYIIAGNAGGRLRQGVYIDAGSVTNDRLLNTMMYANGVPTDNAAALGSGEFLEDMLVER